MTQRITIEPSFQSWAPVNRTVKGSDLLVSIHHWKLKVMTPSWSQVFHPLCWAVCNQSKEPPASSYVAFQAGICLATALCVNLVHLGNPGILQSQIPEYAKPFVHEFFGSQTHPFIIVDVPNTLPLDVSDYWHYQPVFILNDGAKVFNFCTLLPYHYSHFTHDIPFQAILSANKFCHSDNELFQDGGQVSESFLLSCGPLTESFLLRSGDLLLPLQSTSGKTMGFTLRPE